MPRNNSFLTDFLRTNSKSYKAQYVHIALFAMRQSRNFEQTVCRLSPFTGRAKPVLVPLKFRVGKGDTAMGLRMLFAAGGRPLLP